ncbi:MAG: zinc ribbon domain-containing protein [Acidobacteria bacterium]|nr:zinc ribbon domain-containing protein [Acidobacteriota bacterium]MCA1638287.1 zinc ribbon domain-containing protein [Acidobacteriota bacterium]
MIFIIGTKFNVSGSERTTEQHRCPQCGALTQFVKKTGRNYITLFFVLPIIPIGKARNLLECPNCKTRIQVDNL